MQREQWRWGADEEGRREGQGETDWAIPPGSAACGVAVVDGGVTVAFSSFIFYFSLYILPLFFSCFLFVPLYVVGGVLPSDNGIFVVGGATGDWAE
jgi:hypothetical protein